MGLGWVMDGVVGVGLSWVAWDLECVGLGYGWWGGDIGGWDGIWGVWVYVGGRMG